jgi:hypothetical protein
MVDNMMIDIDELGVDYRRNNGTDEVLDNEQYGLLIQIECFLLIRELLRVRENLLEEIFDLRNEVNELAYANGERTYPYPDPGDHLPGNSFYLCELIRTLYEGIFSEDLDF